jgi:desulfoferrodoxin (superoxide reductase-like protein)
LRTLLVTLVFALILVPSLPAEEDAWALHAQSDLSNDGKTGLSEVYLPLGLEQPPSVPEHHVQWTWWPWSAETGSDWPDDDALYRASIRNVSLNSTLNEVVVENHVLPEVEAVALSGKVKVVSAEDRVRMVAFDISITPLENLSNHTILYVVLTENVAEDQHRRQAKNLVREMRPEVAFSVKANNTTDLVSMLPADHLDAAGVHLEETPTGWSYSVAVFGSEEENDTHPRLLALAHGDLPSPSIHAGLDQAWTPLLLSAITAVIVVSIVVAVRQREQAIPKLKATWSGGHATSATITIQAGLHDFSITKWHVSPPWQFKGRPPRQSLSAGGSKTIEVEFRKPSEQDCHIEVAIEIEDYGAWKQHLWLKAAGNEKRVHQEEE